MIRKLLGEYLSGFSATVFYSFSMRAGGAALAFLFSIILGRVLGPAGVGVYFLALTIVNIGSIISRLGLDNAVLKFASISYSEGNLPRFSAVYRKSVVLVSVTGVFCSLLLWKFLPFFELTAAENSEFRDVVFWMLFGIVPLSLVQLQGEFLKARNQPVLGLAVQSTIHQGLLLLVVVGVALMSPARPLLIAVAFSCSIIVTCLITMSYVIARTGINWSESINSKTLLRMGLPLLWVSGLNLMMDWTDIIVLGMYEDSSSVGIYAIAVNVSGLISFFLIAANSVVAPKFAALHYQGKTDELETLARKCTFGLAAVGVPAALLLGLLAVSTLNLFGPGFADGALALRILLIGQIINVVVGPVGCILIMTGGERVVRNNAFLAVAANVIGNLLLIPAFGMIGAAASTAGSLVLKNLLLFAYLRKRMSISTIGFFGGD